MSNEQKAKEVLRVHLTHLNDIIVNAGVIQFADECEEKELITSGAKHQLVSNLTGKSDSHRASSLNDSIRRAVCFEPDFILGQFLSIVFSVGGLPGQALAKTIAEEYGRPLPELDTVIAAAKRANVTMASNKKIKQEDDHSSEAPPPKTKDLILALRELVKWEGFGEQLPEIHTHDINIIKRENPGDIEGQKRELFGKWLRVYPDASWRHVYKALTNAGENKLANEIREKYLPHIHVPEEKATVDVKKEFANGSDKPAEEKPDPSLDSKELYMKSPTLEDVLEVVPADCDCKEFRKALKLPEEKGDFKETISVWIKQEPSDVTWKNLLQALKGCDYRQTVRFIAKNYLQRKSVYDRYIDEPDFENMEDLGL